MALTGSGTLLADKMRLIILSAPQNAGRTSTPASGFCDLARELVTAGVPAVRQRHNLCHQMPFSNS